MFEPLPDGHAWFHFVGQLLPPTWTLAEHEVRTPSGASVRFAGANGVISAWCIAPSDEDLATVKNFAETRIRLAAAAYGFVDRSSFGVRLAGYSMEARHGAFNAVFPGLPSTDIAKEELVRLAIEVPSLGVALTDYAAAIDNPLETPFFAYRAVEVIRTFVTNEPRDADPLYWSQMHAQLNTSREFFEPLRDLSIESRHGHLTWLSEEQRAICLISAGAAIERAVRWHQQDPHGPLSEADHPRLVGAPTWQRPTP